MLPFDIIITLLVNARLKTRGSSKRVRICRDDGRDHEGKTEICKLPDRQDGCYGGDSTGCCLWSK